MQSTADNSLPTICGKNTGQHGKTYQFSINYFSFLFNQLKYTYLSFTSIYIDLFFLVYVDMGTGASDTVNLNLDFTDATNLANQRFFEIKVTQLPCSSEYG